MQKLIGDFITLIMIKKDTVAMRLVGIGAGDEIDQQPPLGIAIQRGGHARRKSR